MNKANKGEWAELYTLVKILIENKVPVLDSAARPVKNKFFKFVELLRQDAGSTLIFIPYGSAEHKSTARTLPPKAELSSLNEKFLREILLSQGSSFASPTGSRIMSLLGISSLKAASNEKVDLSARLAGLEGSEDRKLGFSIKAQLGSPSTLFNAGSNTIFEYRVVGGPVDATEINSISSKSKYVDRVRAIYATGAELEFCSISSEIFPINLDIVESSLQKRLASLIVDSYLYESKRITDVIASAAARSSDPNYSIKTTYQVKNFLRAVALGMVPNSLWDGNLAAYGGYLIVDPNGEVGCLHLQNDDAFKNYLIENTKFDTPAQKSGTFGLVREAYNGEQYFSLSLQIKFLK